MQVINANIFKPKGMLYNVSFNIKVKYNDRIIESN